MENEDKSNISLTFKIPYTELKQKILYARLRHGQVSNPKSDRIIRDKDQLLSIVKEFDKLKAQEPQKIDFANCDVYNFIVWRENISDSFVFFKTQDGFYEGSPLNKKNSKILCHKMPSELVDLLEL